MSEAHHCPQCGAEVPEDAPEGLCPNCVLKAGLQSGGDSLAGISGGGSTGESFEPPTPVELAPHFPDLEILELVGRGGMGVVYKARQKHLNRFVALKILSPSVGKDPAFADRFAREAQAMAMLSHPHIVAVHDFGQAGGMYYFLMEFVDGLNLRRLLDTSKLAPQEALAIVPQICDALQYAHDKGVVHRDIKPENVLMSKEGQVKIADFGLAKLMGREAKDFTLTGAGQVMGTPNYMAPEQIEHPQDVDHRADIYSLGVVFYQMLTGELPLGRFAPPSKKVQIDVRLDEVVLRALEKEPELRYQQASELKTQVESISSGQPPYGERSSVHPVLRAFGRHMRSRWMTPVRTRDGKPTIHWPSAIFITLAIACPIYAFYQFSDWVESLFGKRRHDDPVEGLVEMLISVAITAIGMFFFIRWKIKKPVEEIHDGQLIGRAKAEAAKAATANPLPVIQFAQALEDGDFARAWEKTAAHFQQDVGKDEWVAFMEKVRRPLGKSTRCELLSTNWLNVGTRSETRYRKTFADDSTATETIISAQQTDGEWRVESYRLDPIIADAGQSSLINAQRQVHAPAIGLLVVGILDLVAIPVIVFAMLAWHLSRTPPQQSDTLLLVPFGVLVFAFAAGSFVIFAARRMKRLESYGCAVAACCLAILVTPANLLGLAVGIWALVVLSRAEVSAAFERQKKLKPAKPAATPSQRMLGIAAIVLCAASFPLAVLGGTRAFVLAIFFTFQIVALILGILGRRSLAGKMAAFLSGILLFVLVPSAMFLLAVQLRHDFGGWPSLARVGPQPSSEVERHRYPRRALACQAPAGRNRTRGHLAASVGWPAVVAARRLAVYREAVRKPARTFYGQQPYDEASRIRVPPAQGGVASVPRLRTAWRLGGLRHARI